MTWELAAKRRGRLSTWWDENASLRYTSVGRHDTGLTDALRASFGATPGMDAERMWAEAQKWGRERRVAVAYVNSVAWGSIGRALLHTDQMAAFADVLRSRSYRMRERMLQPGHVDVAYDRGTGVIGRLCRGRFFNDRRDAALAPLARA
jgi:hypothetical protein